MQYEFLRQFSKRMKKIGAYALLMKNSMAKTTWKTYDFNDYDEQINLIFSVMLFIMEESLKEEPCTIDDIGNFIDQINLQYYKKPLTYEQCKDLGRYIVNVILCNDGHPMYVNGFNYEKEDYEAIHINFIGNEIVYLEDEVKRTSYYVTEDGYDLLLSTLEVDSHLQLTIQEMIFKLHLEKATYDKAVEDVKQIFNLLRIQFQKIEEAMRKIRKNALQYSTEDYRVIVEENLATIEGTKAKFLKYREHIIHRVQEFEEKDISIQKLEPEEKEKLNHLRIIESYLTRSLDEHQKILNSHFDLKSLYTKELEDLAQMVLIKRFNLRHDLYDEVLKNPEHLTQLDYFLRPLFMNPLSKTYNLNKSLELQKPIHKKHSEEEFFTNIEEEHDEALWIKEKQERLEKYKGCLKMILTYASKGETTLAILKESLDEEETKQFLPSVEIFKEVMVELLQEKEIDLVAWQGEQNENVVYETWDFQLSRCLLDVLEEERAWRSLKKITIERVTEDDIVTFNQVKSDDGRLKRIQCSNVRITVAN